MNTRINCSEIQVGVAYSQPVFFDDGKNMFLAARQSAKPYHVFVLKRWNIPFLFTAGKKLTAEELNAKPKANEFEIVKDFDELEVLEELEEL